MEETIPLTTASDALSAVSTPVAAPPYYTGETVSIIGTVALTIGQQGMDHPWTGLAHLDNHLPKGGISRSTMVTVPLFMGMGC